MYVLENRYYRNLYGEARDLLGEKAQSSKMSIVAGGQMCIKPPQISTLCGAAPTPGGSP